uniref:F-box/FBD/LRR-repeat protein At1g13570-like isoform X2 n=1 Tax=Nicotiana sylvestris TaxID=4096 RepID=A0A1U7VJJ6_NICSY|nr:PREDICTED: F-box/FBD/LRR-repeat protein At1g13570-like isoform X2 [Nicotiana sylvestris]
MNPKELKGQIEVSRTVEDLTLSVLGDYSYMMPPKGRKNRRSLGPDVISNLPDNVIDVILMRLPCKDAVRTSILSKKWRYHWCRLTKLKLDESLWKTKKDKLSPTVKFTKIIYQILTLHEGPINKFKLDVVDSKRCPTIDNFIYFLSRNDIQHLVLHFPWQKIYKMPSSLFECSQLRHLTLHDCSIHPPSAFKGFSSLVSLELCRVTISFELLESLINHCPLLERLVLQVSEILNIIEINAPMLKSFDFTGSISSLCLKNVPLLTKASLHLYQGSSVEAENFYLAKFFESCFALEHVSLYFGDKFDYACADQAPTRLPFDHNRVKHFYVPYMNPRESYKLSYYLCLIRSFSYLESFETEVLNLHDAGVVESLELERFSDVIFNHLKEVKLKIFSGMTHEMQLIKLFLAKSPVLVRVLIDPSYLCIKNLISLDRRSEIFAEFSNFFRASPKAEVVYMYLDNQTSRFNQIVNFD